VGFQHYAAWTVIFIEVLRLILVLFGAVAGLEIGRDAGPSPATVIGMVLGALIFYVIGGVVGRYLNREQERVADRLTGVPPGELFAGTLTAVGGVLLGAALCFTLIPLVRPPFIYPVTGAVTWIGAWTGYRIGSVKGRQVVAAAGLSRILAPPTEPPPGYALLVDASAVMDRSVLVLGKAGILIGGLVVPRFVVDQVRTLAAGPDPASSRRARRGLEALEALRETGVPVHVAEEELPEVEDPDDRILEMARRLGLRLATCSASLGAKARHRGLAYTDLRQTADALTPEIPPGERLSVDLEKEGNQPRQAVGFLPDGDMVVVNDAAHLVGSQDVVIEVLSTRKTTQGVLVFARLVDC
jgi:uncharacterized protein YacL